MPTHGKQTLIKKTIVCMKPMLQSVPTNIMLCSRFKSTSPGSHIRCYNKCTTRKGGVMGNYCPAIISYLYLFFTEIKTHLNNSDRFSRLYAHKGRQHYTVYLTVTMRPARLM